MNVNIQSLGEPEPLALGLSQPPHRLNLTIQLQVALCQADPYGQVFVGQVPGASKHAACSSNRGFNSRHSMHRCEWGPHSLHPQDQDCRHHVGHLLPSIQQPNLHKTALHACIFALWPCTMHLRCLTLSHTQIHTQKRFTQTFDSLVNRCRGPPAGSIHQRHTWFTLRPQQHLQDPVQHSSRHISVPQRMLAAGYGILLLAPQGDPAVVLHGCSQPPGSSEGGCEWGLVGGSGAAAPCVTIRMQYMCSHCCT